MAQKDLIVRLMAQDGLSATLKDVRSQIQDLGQKSTVLDGIRKEFERITSSTAPAKRQLKDIQTLMASMNLAGLHNTSVFTEMAEYAGTLRDAIGDARGAVNAFANDQFRLEAMGQGLSAIASAGTMAATAMDLFGEKNEEVGKTVKKLQMALTLMNGVQQIANVLNKDSALMLRLKQLRMIGSAAATSGETAATTANTVATGLATKAKQRLNAAMAVGKALMGDWTSLVLAAGTAAAIYTVTVSDSSDELKKQGEEAEKAADKNRIFKDKISESTGTLVGKFQLLAAEWATLKTEAEKTAWLEKNKSAFEQLGLKVDDLKAAEDIFVGNTANVVKALEARAKATALQEQMLDNYREYYRKLDEIEGTVEGGGKYMRQTKFIGQKEFTQAELPKQMRGMTVGEDYTVSGEGSLKTYKYTQQGIEKVLERINAERKSKAKATLDANLKKADEELKSNVEATNARIRAAANEFQTSGASQYFQEQQPRTPAGRSSGTPKGSSKSSAVEDAKFAAGSLADLQAQLKAVDDELRNSNPGEERLEWLKEEGERLSGLIKQRKELLSYEKKEPTAPADPLQEKRDAYADANKRAAQARADLELGIITDVRAADILDEINAKLADLNLPTLDLHVSWDGTEIISMQEELERAALAAADAQQRQAEVAEESRKKLERNAEAIGAMGNAFGSLGGAIGGAGGQIMDFAGKSMQAIEKIIPEIVKLIPALQAKAIAEGLAAGAGVPFPGNIAAIATIVGTITSLFASLPKFETGGIVEGSSYSGDRLLVRVNSGEMVLNRSQQSRLFNMLQGGSSGAPSLPSVITLRAKGPDLVAVIDNVKDKRRRQS